MLRALCVCALAAAFAGCAAAGQPPAASPPTAVPPTVVPSPTPAASPAPPAEPTAVPPTAAPSQAPTAAPTAAPSPTPSPDTGAPTATPAAPRAMDEPVLQGFISLAALHSWGAAAAETARDVRGGSLDERGGAERLADLRQTLESIAAQFEQGAPDPSLADAWDRARAAGPALADIADRWLARRLTAAEAEAALTPLQAQLDQMIASAERGLTGQYGADPARLALIRQQMDRRLRQMR